MDKKYPSDMTIDQSPVIIKEIRKIAKDSVSQENNHVTFNFSWHNHLSEPIESKEPVKKQFDVDYNNIFRSVAKFALDNDMIYSDVLDNIRKSLVEEAINRTNTITKAADMLGYANRTGINSIIKQLENKGYRVEK